MGVRFSEASQGQLLARISLSGVVNCACRAWMRLTISRFGEVWKRSATQPLSRRSLASWATVTPRAGPQVRAGEIRSVTTSSACQACGAALSNHICDGRTHRAASAARRSTRTSGEEPEKARASDRSLTPSFVPSSSLLKRSVRRARLSVLVTPRACDQQPDLQNYTRQAGLKSGPGRPCAACQPDR